MIRIFCFALLFGFTNLQGQTLNHFVIRIDNVKQDPAFTYGRFDTIGQKLKINTTYSDKSSFLDSIQASLNTLDSTNANILVHIHGLWADQKAFYEPNGYILQQEVFDSIKSNYGVILSLQWEGVMNYFHAFSLTKRVGELFANEVLDLDHLLQEQYSSRLGFFLHSMGHRVYDAMLDTIDLSGNDLKVKHLISCGAEIENDFLQDQEVAKANINADEVAVFYNNNDRTLRMATFAKEGNRLGLKGPESTDTLPQNITIHNVSSINDFESRPGKMSRHRYYYDSPTVRHKIIEILTK